MTFSDMTAAFFPSSVISRAEWLYQQRSFRQRLWQRRLGRTILIFGVTMSMILFWGEVVGVLLERDAGPIGDRLQIATVSLLALAISYHFILMFRTLSLAANSISRERQNNTWDMLILTGIDARQIVRGKWAATVWQQWRSYLILGLIRVGAIVWWGAASSRMAMTFNYSYYYGASNIVDIIRPTPWHFLFASFAIIALTMVNLGFTAACGILASTQIRRSALALGRAISLRLLIIVSIIIVVLGLPYILMQITHYQINIWETLPPWLNTIIGHILITLVDNGFTIGSEFGATQIIYPWNQDSYGSIGHIALAVFLSIGIYAALTRLLLTQAQHQAVRHQALPPQ